MDPLPRSWSEQGHIVEEFGTDADSSASGMDEAEHLFPPPGPLPEFEGGLVTAAELRVLLRHDEKD